MATVGLARILAGGASKGALLDVEALAEARLSQSIDGLRLQSPHLSAHRTLGRWQRRVLAVGALAMLLALVAEPSAFLVVLTASAAVVYVTALGYRLLLIKDALKRPHILTIDDDEARAIPDAYLPMYTILVPAYREPEVIQRLLNSIDALEYPHWLLDVKVLLEEDDAETLAAVNAACPGPHIEIVRVPFREPRTKPKACNFGLARARGEFLTIYDAEDRPDPLQLRKAVLALRRADPSVACVQSELSYYNPQQNLITKWFTVEYGMWFREFLPGLVARGAPVPLGGTSNHFRKEVLENLGAWDAYNVTEDADLGIRLHRAGYRSIVLDSPTLEEANSDFVNWMKQRSRWYKGYLQTWLVHLRQPRRLWAELGPGGFVAFNLFVGGTPLLALANPVFWTLTLLWFIGHPAFIQALFPAPVYYLSLLCWAIGNFAVLYASIINARGLKQPGLILAALLSPIYWLMMSMAAVKAALQLLNGPSFWEKTTHGLVGPRGGGHHAGQTGHLAPPVHDKEETR